MRQACVCTVYIVLDEPIMFLKIQKITKIKIIQTKLLYGKQNKFNPTCIGGGGGERE